MTGLLKRIEFWQEEKKIRKAYAGNRKGVSQLGCEGQNRLVEREIDLASQQNLTADTRTGHIVVRFAGVVVESSRVAWV